MTQDQVHAPPTYDPKKARRAAWGALAGTAIEWYDFYVYGTAAALVIGKLFFPNDDPVLRTLASFATFAIGFILRPLGAILFGYIGDRLSRKKALLITLAMMGGGTTGIGLLPTYASAGIWASILLLILRMVQGLSLGGEWGGAVLVASEAAAPNRKMLAASMVQAAGPLGSIASTLVFLILSDKQVLLDWGWRVPFLLSGALLVVAMILRARLEDSEEFKEARKRAEKRKAPTIEAVRHFPLVIVCIFFVSVAVSGTYLRNVFMLNWATETEGMPRSLLLNALLGGAVLQVILTPIAAVIADKVTAERAHVWWTLVYLVAAPIPLFSLVATGKPELVWLGILLSYLGHAFYYSTLAGFTAKLLPTELRFTGLSIGYQLSVTLVASIIPIIAVWLSSSAKGSIWPVEGLYAGLVAVSLVAAVIAPIASRKESDKYLARVERRKSAEDQATGRAEQSVSG